MGFDGLQAVGALGGEVQGAAAQCLVMAVEEADRFILAKDEEGRAGDLALARGLFGQEARAAETVPETVGHQRVSRWDWF